MVLGKNEMSEVIGAIPRFNKFNNETYIWCVDKLPENFILERVAKLLPFISRRDFFTANKDIIINASETITDWNTSLDNYVPKEYHKMNVVGNRLLVREGNDIVLYKVVGFNDVMKKGFLIYLNIK